MVRLIMPLAVIALLSLLTFLDAGAERSKARVVVRLAAEQAERDGAEPDAPDVPTGWAVRGVLRGARSGPLPEAWVVATQGKRRELMLTDAEGRYEASLPTGGAWSVAFEADGHVTQAHPVTVDGIEALDVVLVPLARLSGVVKAAGGVPAGLAVQASSTGTESTIHRGAVDAEGRFSFAVEPGTYELHLVLAGYHWAAQRRLAIAPADDAVTALALGARGSVAGDVTLRETECTFVRVEATHVETRRTRAIGLDPAQTHSFRLDDLEPGRWILEATLKPGGQRFSAAVEVVAETTSPVALGATQATLTGFIDPAVAARVRVHAFLDATAVESHPTYRATAGGDGCFSLAGVEPGAYVVVVESGGAITSMRVDVAPHTTTTVRPRLVHERRSLRVLAQGRAFAGKSVQLILQPYQRVRRWVRTDDEGVAVTTGLPAGRYLVRRGRCSTFVQLDGHADAVLPTK